jgi:hypothetical protein
MRYYLGNRNCYLEVKEIITHPYLVLPLLLNTTLDLEIDWRFLQEDEKKEMMILPRRILS